MEYEAKYETTRVKNHENKKQKKVYVGPKVHHVDLYRILNAEKNLDKEVLGLTTLMIKNIPVKFMQQDMLTLINQKFKFMYNYFYLPMDLKT